MCIVAYTRKHGGERVPEGEFSPGKDLWVVGGDGRRHRHIPTGPGECELATEYCAKKQEALLASVALPNSERISSSPCSLEPPM